MRADSATDKRAGGDTKVENTRRYRHGNGCGIVGGVVDYLVLKGDIIGRSRHSPESTQADNQRDSRCGRIQKEQAEEHAEERKRDEKRGIARVEARKSDAAQYACAAKKHKREGDKALGHVCHLKEEGFDVRVARVVRRGEKERERENADERAVAEYLGHTANGETTVARYAGKRAEEVDKGEERKGGNAEESHAPADLQADKPPERQSENHGDRGARDDHAEGKRAMRLGDDMNRQGGYDRPEDGMGAGYADTRCHEHAVGRRKRREDLEDHKEEGYDEHQPAQFDPRG